MTRLVSKMSLLVCALTLSVGTAYANEKCKACHADIVAKHATALHGKAGLGCDACHGGVDAHLASGNKKDIITFGKGDAAKQDAQCLTCHAKNQKLMFWDNSKHKGESVSCASCHGIHSSSKPMPQQPERCFECHKDVKSEANKLSHHPIIEGKVKCSDCHNPHGTLSKNMIKAETVNLLCYTCHADKRGPFIQEHPPVSEDCAICHTPHGSKNYRLTREKMPNLCNACHGGVHGTGQFTAANSFAATPANRSGRFLAQSCINCHNNIHGTNAPTNRGQHFER